MAFDTRLATLKPIARKGLKLALYRVAGNDGMPAEAAYWPKAKFKIALMNSMARLACGPLRYPITRSFLACVRLCNTAKMHAKL